MTAGVERKDEQLRAKICLEVFNQEIPCPIYPSASINLYIINLDLDLAHYGALFSTSSIF